MDERGYCRIGGRLKDMIIRGGVNIYPREIEQVLFEHPDVADVAVVGVPDEKWGEQIAAFIRPRPARTPTEDELFAYCREHLAPYKTPRFWDLRRRLPDDRLREDPEVRAARALQRAIGPPTTVVSGNRAIGRRVEAALEAPGRAQQQVPRRRVAVVRERVDRPAGSVHQRRRATGHALVAELEGQLALEHVERLGERVVVQRRACPARRDGDLDRPEGRVALGARRAFMPAPPSSERQRGSSDATTAPHSATSAPTANTACTAPVRSAPARGRTATRARPRRPRRRARGRTR